MKFIKNIAKQKPITKNDAQKVAAEAVYRREMNADDIQIIRRVSNVVNSGLKYGAPPPVVGP